MQKISKKAYIKKSPKIKTIIHWYDLPNNKVLILNQEFQKELMKEYASLKYGFKKKITKRLGVSVVQLKLWVDCKSNFSVGSLKKIGKFFKTPFNDIEKNIIGFGRKRIIKNPKFPFDMSSSEGIALRSIINSEGHISKQIGRSVMIRVPEIEMLQLAIKVSKKLFGEFEIEIKKTKDKNTHEIFLPGGIGDILVISGLTRGRKSFHNPYVPRDIMLGSLEKKKIYLQWSLAGEMECTRNSKILKITRNVIISNLLGSLFINKLRNGATYKNEIPEEIKLKLSECPPNLLIGEAIMLQSFGIERQPYFVDLWKHKNKEEVSAAWTIPITNKKEITILLYKIGIPLSEKSNKVHNILLSYKRN